MSSSFVAVILSLYTSSVVAFLPQVSQEGLLRPYRSYADVTLFHYYVPRESNLATFEFAAFMDSPKCPARNVHIYLQHGSYPVMSADNAEFPPDLFTNRTSMFSITLQSTFQPHNASMMKIYYPLPGSWFAAAYLQNWDMPVQQEGLGHKCQYSLGSIAIWSQVANIESLPLNTGKKLITYDHYSYYRFFIPTGTWEFTLTVDGCSFTSTRRSAQPPGNSVGNQGFTVKNTNNDTEVINTTPCLSLFVQARRLPDYNPSNSTASSVTEERDSVFTHIESLPFTDSYYYLLIVSETKVSYNIKITTQECPIKMLGKSFIQRFTGIDMLLASAKDQALRMNMSSDHHGAGPTDTCRCISIYRLTRVKHPQDFSDTFLLESKDWFTTWLALPVKTAVGVALEILPYVDIGGTLSISVHLDDLLMNATLQTVSVTACIRKSRPPETFCCASSNISDCCESGLTLHISSTSFSTMDSTVLIPYPEPDTWFISFTTVCSYKGNVVPCAVQEVLISLDIRTQPCVLTKPQSPGGYRGWACSDDREATPESLLLATTLLLTLSNAFFVPAIFLACRRQFFTHALVYLCTMTASTLYHACDQDIFGYCLIRYQVLQFCDFFCSILSFWVTLISLAKCKYDSTLYMLGAIVIAVGVEYNRTGLIVFIVPFCLGIGVPIAVWTYRSVQSRKLLKPDKGSLLLFIPGVLLGAAGLILFAFVETEENYRFTLCCKSGLLFCVTRETFAGFTTDSEARIECLVYNAWHAIIALSLVYLLPKTLRRASSNKSGTACSHTNGHLEVSNSAELASVTDPNTSTPDQAPVFFITSELDHLVQEVPVVPR